MADPATAAIAAEVIAPEVIGGMAAGEGLGMLSAGEAASLISPELAFGGQFGADLAASELGGSELLGGFGMAPDVASGLAGQLMQPQSIFGSPLEGIAQPGFARGAATQMPGASGLFGPMATTAEAAKIGLSGKQAMMAAQMANALGGGQDRPLGSPPLPADPNMRAQMVTQEEITKKWLLKNDPSTYARLYGAPQG